MLKQETLLFCLPFLSCSHQFLLYIKALSLLLFPSAIQLLNMKTSLATLWFGLLAATSLPAAKAVDSNACATPLAPEDKFAKFSSLETVSLSINVPQPDFGLTNRASQYFTAPVSYESKVDKSYRLRVKGSVTSAPTWGNKVSYSFDLSVIGKQSDSKRASEFIPFPTRVILASLSASNATLDNDDSQEEPHQSVKLFFSDARHRHEESTWAWKGSFIAPVAEKPTLYLALQILDPVDIAAKSPRPLQQITLHKMTHLPFAPLDPKPTRNNVELVIPTGDVFYSNEEVLAERSPHFKTLLMRTIPKRGGRKTVHIEETYTKEAFLSMLEFIHRGTVSTLYPGHDDFPTLLQLAATFKVKYLGLYVSTELLKHIWEQSEDTNLAALMNRRQTVPSNGKCVQIKAEVNDWGKTWPVKQCKKVGEAIEFAACLPGLLLLTFPPFSFLSFMGYRPTLRQLLFNN
jgi:hypothetical protein